MGVHVPLGVHLPRSERVHLKLKTEEKKYAYILYISNYLYIYQ